MANREGKGEEGRGGHQKENVARGTFNYLPFLP